MRDLEPAFADAEDDWIRISPFTWLLWSPKMPLTVYNKIKPLLDEKDQFLLTKVDTEASMGFLSPWVWNWINKKIPGSIVTGDDLKKLGPPSS